jgi:hypothetical protein
LRPWSLGPADDDRLGLIPPATIRSAVLVLATEAPRAAGEALKHLDAATRLLAVKTILDAAMGSLDVDLMRRRLKLLVDKLRLSVSVRDDGQKGRPPRG